MIKDKRKIKDIFGCNYIKTSEEIYPLQKWYNNLLDKKICEVDIKDILKMIRQNEFVNLAILMAINYLKENPFAGDMYEGELMEKLLKIDNNKLKLYSNELKGILANASELNKNYEWLIEEERLEFEKIINSIEIIL